MYIKATSAAVSSSSVPYKNRPTITISTASTAAPSSFTRLSSQAKRRKGLQALASAVVQKRNAPDDEDTSYKKVISVVKIEKGGD